MFLRTMIVGGLIALTSLVAPSVVRGQQVPAAPPSLPEAAPISATQIQRWFEAFTVLQAQEALDLPEAQYGRFVTRLKALQETRRRHHQARSKLLGEMRKLTNPQTGTQDDAQLSELLKSLRDADERGAVELRKSYEAVDETLDIRQQARFRVFEERMEQQKLDLLTRARQNARGAGRGRGQS